MADIANMDREQSFKTIGGEMVVFRKNRKWPQSFKKLLQAESFFEFQI